MTGRPTPTMETLVTGIYLQTLREDSLYLNFYEQGSK